MDLRRRRGPQSIVRRVRVKVIVEVGEVGGLMRWMIENTISIWLSQRLPEVRH